MKHLAAYILLVLGGNENPSADDVTAALSSVGIEADSDALNRLLADIEGKSLDELIEAGKPHLAKFGSGGGGGGGGGAAGGAGAAAEDAPKEEEKKEEEEEMDLGGGMDMFGGDEGGGDY